ncbi:MAG: permease [Acidimicrobium sp.]|nr:sulfite exporter TauE/SafE family protein [Ilumatobacteraceae bacterium]PHX71480.1 MAG: permease [Acidimicrobium sp.]
MRSRHSKPTTSSEAATFPTVVLVGMAAGFLSGMFGVGGGILIVPGLVLVAKMDQRIAHGTSLAAVLPISVASLMTYWSHDHVDWRVGLCLATGALVGAILGTKLLNVLPHRTLTVAFAGILLLTAIRLFLPIESGTRGILTIGNIVALIAIGVATGILAGLLGVGGGVIMVPAMMMLLHLPSAMAKGTSVLVIIPTSLMGTYRNRTKKNVDLRAATAVGLSGIPSAIVGGWISARMSDTVSNVLFASLLLVVAIRLVRQIRSDDKAGIVH